jgi:hypothetical protein
MHFHIHHHIEPSSEVLSRLDAINQKLDRMERLIMADYTKLTADITAQKTVLQGIVLGVQGLNASNAAQSQQISDLKTALAAASVTDPTVQAAVDALDQSVQDNTGLVANLIPAVTANTPTPLAAAAAAATAAAAPAA